MVIVQLKEIKKTLKSNIQNIDLQSDIKYASVLVVIYDSNPYVLMTKKASHLNIHAGEIAFPGGKWETDDIDLLDTALRETREEIDLDVNRDDVISQLKSVSTLNSGFVITPYVAILDKLPILNDNHEVESILHIPLIPFLKTLSPDLDPQHQSIKEMYTLKFENHLVWGASARILKQIHDLFSKNNLL